MKPSGLLYDKLTDKQYQDVMEYMKELLLLHPTCSLVEGFIYTLATIKKLNK